MTRPSRFSLPVAVAALCIALSAPALAEEAVPAISVELNALDPVEGACRLVFVARNGLEADVASLILEAVAFDPEGGVARISLFDFGELPAGRIRVRQFDLPKLSCDGVGSLLINGVQTCEGVEDCPLAVSSRTEVELLG